MADTKISALGAASALAGTEVVPVVQGGTTKKATITQLLKPAAGQGIDYSANTPAAGMTSQLLNWYEEGTFTPAIAGSVAGVGTYTAQSGNYTRLGNRVFFNLYVAWSAHTGTGFMYITGLPFTSLNNANNYSAVSLGEMQLTLSANNILCMEVEPNTTRIILLQYATGGGSVAQVTINASGYLIVSGSYLV